jgi:hypothetical protein
MATVHKADGRRTNGQKTNKENAENIHKASPAALERSIRGIHFPATKEDLLEQARKNKAPQSVIDVLDRFRDEHYSTVWEIAHETGRVNHGDDTDDSDEHDESHDANDNETQSHKGHKTNKSSDASEDGDEKDHTHKTDGRKHNTPPNNHKSSK